MGSMSSICMREHENINALSLMHLMSPSFMEMRKFTPSFTLCVGLSSIGWTRSRDICPTSKSSSRPRRGDVSMDHAHPRKWLPIDVCWSFICLCLRGTVENNLNPSTSLIPRRWQSSGFYVRLCGSITLLPGLHTWSPLHCWFCDI